MKYSNKIELVDTIKNNSNLFIKEYSDVEETCMNKIDKKISRILSIVRVTNSYIYYYTRS